MSSCWKCGKEVPEGQVECEDGCGGEPSLDAAPGEIVLVTRFRVDRAKISNKQELDQFDHALKVFAKNMKDAFDASGLSGFTKS